MYIHRDSGFSIPQLLWRKMRARVPNTAYHCLPCPFSGALASQADDAFSQQRLNGADKKNEILQSLSMHGIYSTNGFLARLPTHHLPHEQALPQWHRILERHGIIFSACQRHSLRTLEANHICHSRHLP
jgi:hypothetical protein